MKASLALAVFLMGACQPPEEEPIEDSADTGLLELGSIEGKVSLEVDLEFSHDYTLFVLGSIETHESGVLPLRIHHTPVAMLSLEDGSLSFSLKNLFPQDGPYYVIAILDVDDSVGHLGQFTLTPGDVSTTDSVVEQIEVFVSSGERVELDLQLSHLIE